LAEFERRGPGRTYTEVSCNLAGGVSSYCSATYVDSYTPTGVSCNSGSDCGTGEICDLCPTVGGYPQIRTRVCKNPGDADQCEWNDWGVCTVTGECGNGTVEGGEQCDDANDIDTDACVDCQNSRCGDGFARVGIEICDAGTANGTPCTAPYGSTCNYCSRECTLRTASGPTCGDGTVNVAEQCDSRLPSYPASWICVDTSNPWTRIQGSPAPGCSPSSCAITCATGRACNNVKYDSAGRYNLDSDHDGIIDACDPNDNSDVDGCMDDATDCATVDLRVTADAGDAFRVYIDNHEVVQWRFCILGAPCLTAQINTLSRGRHNLRIVYVGGTSPGNYRVIYNLDGTIDFGLDSSPVIPEPSPPIEHIGEERSIYFTVR